MNKGNDNKGVSPYIDILEVIDICKKNYYNNVLVGHNHPAGVLAPSKQDRIFLEQYIDSLIHKNITVEHFVFSAGHWEKYGLSLGQHIRRFFDLKR